MPILRVVLPTPPFIFIKDITFPSFPVNYPHSFNMPNGNILAFIVCNQNKKVNIKFKNYTNYILCTVNCGFTKR